MTRSAYWGAARLRPLAEVGVGFGPSGGLVSNKIRFRGKVQKRCLLVCCWEHRAFSACVLALVGGEEAQILATELRLF